MNGSKVYIVRVREVINLLEARAPPANRTKGASKRDHGDRCILMNIAFSHAASEEVGNAKTGFCPAVIVGVIFNTNNVHGNLNAFTSNK